jgi:hypothetical protein
MLRICFVSSFILFQSLISNPFPQISLGSRDGAIAPPRRPVKDSTAKHPP